MSSERQQHYNNARRELKNKYQGEYRVLLAAEKRKNPRSAGKTSSQRSAIDTTNVGRAVQALVNLHYEEYRYSIRTSRAAAGERAFNKAKATYQIRRFIDGNYEFREQGIVTKNTRDLEELITYLRKKEEEATNAD